MVILDVVILCDLGIWSPQALLPFPCATDIFVHNCVFGVGLSLCKYVRWLIRQKLVSFSGECKESYYNILKNSLSGWFMRKCLRGNSPGTGRMKEVIIEKVGAKLVSMVHACFLQHLGTLEVIEEGSCTLHDESFHLQETFSIHFINWDILLNQWRQ